MKRLSFVPMLDDDQASALEDVLALSWISYGGSPEGHGHFLELLGFVLGGEFA